MPSPISILHSEFEFRLGGWLWTYVAATPGCALGAPSTWLMSDDNAPQPDIALMILPQNGGQSRIEGKYAAGAPELVGEVSYMTYVSDVGLRKNLYERSGVKDYLIIQPAEHKLIWNVLRQGKYQELTADSDGIFRSPLFPGLWLNPAQLWNGDLQGIAKTVQQGAATVEDAAFVRKLARRKR